MHVPIFPPKLSEWLPGNPWEKEPPLPRFLWNPHAPFWLPPEVRKELENKYGYYVTRRVEAMIGPREGVEGAKRAAEAMYERVRPTLLGVPTRLLRRAPPGRPRERVPTPRVPAKPILTEEEIGLMKEDILSSHEILVGRPAVVEKWPSAEEVVDWVKEYHGKKIPRDYALYLIEEAKKEFVGVG